jgi:hypothetical protein
MNVRTLLQRTPVTHPLIGPVTTLTTIRHRRRSGHFRGTGEATVCGMTPDFLMPEPAREGVLR